jgi:hypothetical protein
MSSSDFEKLLTGGHPNSLGNTLEVVKIVLEDKSKLIDLFNCYFSPDEVVRLRTSSAFKRICIQHPDWIYEYTDRLIEEISKINQASTQWTLAILFRLLTPLLTQEQRSKSLEILKINLDNHTDWIVINTTMETLFEWSKSDNDLEEWLRPRLEKFVLSDKKSIAGRAKKYLNLLNQKL